MLLLPQKPQEPLKPLEDRPKRLEDPLKHLALPQAPLVPQLDLLRLVAGLLLHSERQDRQRVVEPRPVEEICWHR